MDDTNNPCIVAIGNFDGVHKGHAALLAHARTLADTQGLPLVALTFEPHPRQFFKPDDKPFRLTPEHVKERRLKASGADRVEILDFNEIMASLTPQQFIDFMLVDHLNAAHVVVGDEFHFGRNRAGTLATLQGDTRFKTHALPLLQTDSAPVSSTRIRQALEAGDIKAANTMLGWDWEIEADVIHGDKRGRTWGYPTANLVFAETLVPAYGVYAVRVDVGDGIWRKAAANIGVRPMFAVKQPLLEVYILDFDGDLYGRTLRVQPVQKLRDEAKFDDIEALKVQMDKDVAQARAILS